jgi:hypothetical protein
MPGGDSQDEIKITPEMIEAGLEWLYGYDPESSDPRATIRFIIQAALANRPQYLHSED